MSIFYWKVTVETFSKLWFSGFKKFVTRSVFGELQLMQISLNFKTSFCEVWEENYVWLFYYFNFERNYDVLKIRSPRILLKKNIGFIKTKRNRKTKIPQTVLKRRTLCFNSYKNRKLKVKLWWVGARERKKRAFFVPFILLEGNFFKICVYLNV